MYVCMYVYQRRHVHVETRRRLTKFEVRTQVPPLIHWCVIEKAMLIWYYGIYTQRLNNNNNYAIMTTAVYHNNLQNLNQEFSAKKSLC